MTDTELIDSVEVKLDQIRDRVRGVVEKYSTGVYIWGPGGMSKTYTVTETLEKCRRPYLVTNSRLTGLGLFDLLDSRPDSIHVLDDVETLFADKNAQGVLRAALWSQDERGRLVIWQTGTKGRREVMFTGGIIMIGNTPIGEVPALKALATRIPIVRYAPTSEEVAAMLRRIAHDGYPHPTDRRRRLNASQCREVVEQIVRRSLAMNRPLDIRIYVNTCRDRLQYEAGGSATHWTDLLEGRLQERVISPLVPMPRESESSTLASLAEARV